jgi:hypothetical protein
MGNPDKKLSETLNAFSLVGLKDGKLLIDQDEIEYGQRYCNFSLQIEI